MRVRILAVARTELTAAWINVLTESVFPAEAVNLGDGFVLLHPNGSGSV
jgi:hypothetical protein